LELQEAEVDNFGESSFDSINNRSDTYEEDNYEDDSNLETANADSPPSSFLVTFENKFPDPITLYWQGDNPTNEKFKIGDIEAYSEINVDTFPGHTFYATKLGTNEKVQTSKVKLLSSLN